MWTTSVGTTKTSCCSSGLEARTVRNTRKPHAQRRRTVPEKNIHYEAFGPATVKKLRAAAPPPAADASAAAIEVTFVKSGKTIAWEPDAGSLLEFAEAHGVNIESGCRAGNCSG